MKRYEALYYKTARGDSPVEEFVLSLQPKVAQKVLAMVQFLEEMGPQLRRPYVDHVRGAIRELRISFAVMRSAFSISFGTVTKSCCFIVF